MNKYKFKATFKEQHLLYGSIEFRGNIVIKAHNLEEAIYYFKQSSLTMTEVPRACLVYTVDGKIVEFTVEPVEEDVK